MYKYIFHEFFDMNIISFKLIRSITYADLCQLVIMFLGCERNRL